MPSGHESQSQKQLYKEQSEAILQKEERNAAMPEIELLIPEHVFISYSHIDREVAKTVRSDLENAGISTWIDDRLEPGTPDWEREVRNAVARSFAVVVIASPHSLNTPYVRGELLFAN